MFGFRSVKKSTASPSRAAFRRQLEGLEGRALMSGLVPVSQDLAPQGLFQGPANNQIQVQEVIVQSSPQFGQVSLKVPVVSHVKFSGDDLKTTPPWTGQQGSTGTDSHTPPFKPDHTVLSDNLFATSGLLELYGPGGPLSE
jgi:hypothetical protein